MRGQEIKQEKKYQEKTRDESDEDDHLSEHNVEGKDFKEEITGDGKNLLLLLIFFLDVAIRRVIEV